MALFELFFLFLLYKIWQTLGVPSADWQNQGAPSNEWQNLGAPLLKVSTLNIF